MPGTNLDLLIKAQGSQGDFGVFDPVNAWPGAKDAIVSVIENSYTLVQIGFEKSTPEMLWVRQRPNSTGEWTDWWRGAEGGGGESGGEGGGDMGIEEAPMDGQSYTRRDGQWVVLESIEEAPLDGQSYARRSEQWAAMEGIEEAPIDGLSYTRRNGDWVVLVQMWTGDYMFSNTLVEPPASGQLRLNNSDQKLATKMWISGMSAPGNDITFYLKLLDETRGIYIQDQDDATRHQSYRVTGDAILKSGYVEVPVAWLKGDVAITAQRILVTIMHIIPDET